MTVERIRAFRGATELSYGSCVIVKSNDTIVDEGRLSIEADSNVAVGSVIDFKKADGTTTIFSGNVDELKKTATWDLRILTNGYELNNVLVEQVYSSATPEDIVQDVVDNYTENLTYASTNVSGFTIEKYIADKYAIDIIKDMMDLLDWQIRIDETGNVYFEPMGNVDNGITFTNGDNFNVIDWNRDSTTLVNSLKVKGGNVTNRTQETDAGDGSETSFTVSHKPVGVMRITLDGTELSPSVEDSAYTVDSENKTITFSSAPGIGVVIVFDYEFHIPIVVTAQNDDSITAYKERYKYISIPEISTFDEARSFAVKYVDVYGDPSIKVKGIQGYINFTRTPGELVTVVDTIRGESEILVINKITIDMNRGTTEYELGSSDFIFLDWQAEVQNRIKKLENQINDEDIITVARSYKSSLNVDLSVSQTFKYNFPVDSFILGHPTLSRLRPNLNFEADCSDNANHGTWTGTGIDGSQYTTDGRRLSAGQFNGSDRIITVSDDSSLDLNSDFAIALSIKVSPLPSALTYIMNKWDGTDGWAVRIASDNKIELIYSNSGSDSTLKATTALSDDTYQHIIFVKSGTDLTIYINGVSDNTGTGDATAGTNTEDFIIGKYSTNFFSGEIDEIRLYNDSIESTKALNIYNKYLELEDCTCYLSMDNPRLGDRSSALQVVS